LSASNYVQRLIAYVNHLLCTSNVMYVHVMEVLHRQQPRRQPRNRRQRHVMHMSFDEYNAKVDEAMRLVRERGVPVWQGRALYERHEKRLHTPQLLSNDGVHLTPHGVQLYWRSIRGVILRHLDQLPNGTSLGGL